MGATPIQPPAARREFQLALTLFVVALTFHFWGATVGWKSLNLPGCEFRQTQTAISAFFIQKEHNFSLAYPTPVLGKPWAIPMEFPLYQWSVVWVSDGLRMPLTQAGRAVSVACFYLGLPALYLLLGSLGLKPARRLLVLGLVVVCPLYIFYARAFLIETMALMFGAWFLLGYGRAVEKRSLGWLLLTAAAGAGCGLVKVTTLFFFLIPALLWTLGWFQQDWRQPAGARWLALRRRVWWCALALAIPFAASIWWVHYSDAIKARTVAGQFLVSNRLTGYNFGTGVRFSADLWRQHWQVLFHDLTSVPALALCSLLALVFARHWWRWLVLLVFLFFVVQVIFPVLYAWHEYYYVASGFTLMFAYGLVVCAVFEARLPRLAVWVVALLVYGLQMGEYLNYYFPSQRQISNGGDNLTLALRHVMAPNEVMVIAGDDWSSMTPYYAERRAFMIRRALEHTWDVIIPTFEQLKGEEVTALVLHGDQVKNQVLIDLAVKYFHLDPRPAFRVRDATVFLHEQIRPQTRALLLNIPEVVVLEEKPGEVDPRFQQEHELGYLLSRFRGDFAQLHPAPFKYFTTYGTAHYDYEGRQFIGAHPDTRIWFKLPAGRHTLTAQFALLPAAYDEKVPRGDRSDGVEFRLEKEVPDDSPVVLYSRLINPRDQVADRGPQTIHEEFVLAEAGMVFIAVGPGPHGSYSRDWSVLGPVEIK